MRPKLERPATAVVPAALALGLAVVGCTARSPTGNAVPDPHAVSASFRGGTSSNPAVSGGSVRAAPGLSFAVVTTTETDGSTVTTFDFEEAPNGGVLGDLYAADGIHFENASAYDLSRNHYYPPHSDSMIVTATIPPTFTGGSGVVTVTFDAPVIAFGAYATSDSALVLRCFDAQGGTVGTAVLQTPNLNDGMSPYPPNQYIEVSGAGIVRCTFTGTNNYYTLDDFAVRRAGAELVLTCLPSPLVRGDTLRCSVAASPPEPSLTVRAWHFVPADSTLGTDISPPAGTPLKATWSGEMAASGTVRVTATVGGMEHDTAAPVTVLPRDWSAMPVQWTWVDSSPDALPIRPKRFDGQFGETTPIPKIDGRTLVIIPSGPNEGLIYFSRPPARVDISGAVNTLALRRGSAFYWAQPAMTDPNVLGGVRHCTRADVLRAVDLVWLHEGTQLRQPGSHVDTYLREFERLSRRYGEGIVSAGDFHLDSAVKVWHDSALAYSARMTDTVANPLAGRLTCVFNYTYSPGGP